MTGVLFAQGRFVVENQFEQAVRQIFHRSLCAFFPVVFRKLKKPFEIYQVRGRLRSCRSDSNLGWWCSGTDNSFGASEHRWFVVNGILHDANLERRVEKISFGLSGLESSGERERGDDLESHDFLPFKNLASQFLRGLAMNSRPIDRRAF